MKKQTFTFGPREVSKNTRAESRIYVVRRTESKCKNIAI